MEAQPTGIALGSNLGDRLENLRSALRDLRSTCRPSPILQSSVYETEPVDCPPGSQPFLNAVIELTCDLSPRDLLLECQAIEARMGRKSIRETNDPRPVDLDILYFGKLVLSEPDLIIPHPRLAIRRFVLEPLNEIRPELVLPGKSAPVKTLLGELVSDEPELRLFHAPGW